MFYLPDRFFGAPAVVLSKTKVVVAPNIQVLPFSIKQSGMELQMKIHYKGSVLPGRESGEGEEANKLKVTEKVQNKIKS